MKRDIIRNENTMGITVISKIKMCDRENTTIKIETHRNGILKNNKYIINQTREHNTSHMTCLILYTSTGG